MTIENEFGARHLPATTKSNAISLVYFIQQPVHIHPPGSFFKLQKLIKVFCFGSADVNPRMKIR